MLRALRDPGRNLKEYYKTRPLELAAKFGIKLPKKPVTVMLELGVITEEEAAEKFGKIEPGLRELVEDVTTLQVTDACAVANRGGGKAGSVEIPVPTPFGWKRLGDLVVGDKVFDEQGRVCHVTKAYPIMNGRPCSEIIFNDGSGMIVDDDHLWLTSTAASRHADRYSVGGSKKPQQMRTSFASVKTTAEIRDTLTIKAGRGRRDFHHQVRNSGPLVLRPKKLPIDPYLLGLWLGDGCAWNGTITVGHGDEAVIEQIEQLGPIKKYKGNGSAHLICVPGLGRKIKDLGLYRNKHVPNVYLRGSEQQRLDLLAGLMDSDGTTRSTSNNCQFDNTNERLANAVYELVVSLGWKATRSKKIGKLYGVEHKPVHRVSFRPTKQIFRNPRKAERLDFSVSQQSRHLSRTVVAVRSVPSVPVRCVEVDSESHLFLWGEQMVPTHNSFGVSFIEFFLWLLHDYDALNLGGSEWQADQVYQYLVGYLDEDPYWISLVKGDPQREKTTSLTGSWVVVLAASQKSVRSRHAGGTPKKRRGGILVVDEEAEAEKDVVEAALGTVNTARPSVTLRCSTFHNLEGSFQELIDNHVVMGYKLYRWDIFDVAEPCDCVDGCESEEVCFREDHYENFMNPDTGEMERRLIHRAYCGGRAKYSDGWITMREILAMWRRMKRNHSRWEVEAMGSRPSTAGHVIKDLNKFSENIANETGSSLYRRGYPVDINVDWGTGAAGVEVWQEQAGGKHVLLHADEIKENNETQILGVVLSYAKTYERDLVEIAADIGGGGNYLNPKLREEHHMPVRDVNFAELKETAVAAWNILNEAGLTVIPAEHEEFIHQVKNWKRKNGRIQKGDDHLCDTAICHFAKMIERLGLKKVRIPPRSFKTAAVTQDRNENHRNPGTVGYSRRNRPRVPVVRSFRRPVGQPKAKRR